MAEPKGTIVLGAGGTGGHMFPAQALADELTKRGYDIVLITDERGKAYTDRFPTSRMEIVRAATFAGRNPLKRIGAMFQIVQVQIIFHVMQINEFFNLAVTIAGEVSQDSLAFRFFIQTFNRHDW